jgi:hypothetical protein
VGRPLGGPRRRHGHRARQHRSRTRFSPPASSTSEFIDNATSGFEAFASTSPAGRSRVRSRVTGVPERPSARSRTAFARAPHAMICWTLGITEHHNAVDNVLSLINLALLCGHVGRYGSGLNPLRGQNNVQGGGDMGAIPDRLAGFQHVENRRCARVRARLGRRAAAQEGPAPVRHVRRDGARHDEGALRHRRESDAQRSRSGAHPQAPRGARLPGRAGHFAHRHRRGRRCRPAGSRRLVRVRRAP